MRVFQLAQQHQLELQPGARGFFSRTSGLVTRHFSMRKGPREIFQSDCFAQRRGRLRPPDDAPGRFSRALHPGVRSSSPASCSTSFFTATPRTNTRWSASRNSIRSCTTDDPKLAVVSRAIRETRGPVRSLSRAAPARHRQRRRRAAALRGERALRAARRRPAATDARATTVAHPAGGPSPHAFEHGAAAKPR